MDEDPDELAAGLQNEAIEAMRALVEDHDYSDEDLQGLVRSALGE